ncbi:hypothetical protein JKP88DRAFT_263622 [Tribonema minus]|uniref:JmjC domain-containing protein n=1 Tax=Tribonema minus TaxID=303371 RepID=A0A835YWU2_9STRA|nr:hypothetical protein JKP88DRAFT_263622 [Tribonema minus]
MRRRSAATKGEVTPPPVIRIKPPPETTAQRLRKNAGYYALAFIISSVVIKGIFDKNHHTELPILHTIAKHNMNWVDSTTAAPISVPSVLAKLMLAKEPKDWPEGLTLDEETLAAGTNAKGWRHTVPLSAARRSIEARVLQEVAALCGSTTRARTEAGPLCDPNERDPVFGMTPLHMARLQGDDALAEYLLTIGADPNVEDTVGRKPSNMTFQSFAVNSKKWALARGSECQIPEVSIDPANPEAGLREVRRLVGEGEPVMVRNAMAWLSAARGEPLLYPTSAKFAEAWGERPVDVAGVPYAAKFNVTTARSTLSAFRAEHMGGSDALATSTGDTPLLKAAKSDKKPAKNAEKKRWKFTLATCLPLNDDTQLLCCELMRDYVMAALPVQGGLETPGGPLMCPPTNGGMDIMHYFMGDKGTGAPFHVHSDAINLMLTGSKKWWVLPPRQATFSRMHIKEWAAKLCTASGDALHALSADLDSTLHLLFARAPLGTQTGRLESRDAPMECLQNAGDLAYVPFDWGHAAINEVSDSHNRSMCRYLDKPYRCQILLHVDVLLLESLQNAGDLAYVPFDWGHAAINEVHTCRYS